MHEMNVRYYKFKPMMSRKFSKNHLHVFFDSLSAIAIDKVKMSLFPSSEFVNNRTPKYFDLRWKASKLIECLQPTMKSSMEILKLTKNLSKESSTLLQEYVIWNQNFFLTIWHEMHPHICNYHQLNQRYNHTLLFQIYISIISYMEEKSIHTF